LGLRVTDVQTKRRRRAPPPKVRCGASALTCAGTSRPRGARVNMALHKRAATLCSVRFVVEVAGADNDFVRTREKTGVHDVSVDRCPKSVRTKLLRRSRIWENEVAMRKGRAGVLYRSRNAWRGRAPAGAQSEAERG